PGAGVPGPGPGRGGQGGLHGALHGRPGPGRRAAPGDEGVGREAPGRAGHAGSRHGAGVFALGGSAGRAGGTDAQRVGAATAEVVTPSAHPPPPAYEWRLPPGFPVPRVPADNPMTPAKVELGRRLFYDRVLSGNGAQACSSCHRQELAFTDGRARAVGSTGEPHPRGALSLANVAYGVTLTWADPRLTRLENQARIPMFSEHPVELGLFRREDEVLRRLRAEPDYPGMFAAAFPEEHEPVRVANVTRAIACFERTLISGDSPYDRLVYRDDAGALSESAKRGMRLFFSERLNCSRCHGGFTFSGPITFDGARPIAATFHNNGLYNLGGDGSYPADNPGF